MILQFSPNVISTLIAAIIAGGLIIGTGNLVNNHVSYRTMQQESPVVTPSAQKISVSPIPLEIPKPSATNSFKVIGSTNTAISDGLINCNFPHSGTIRLSASKCDQMTDCQLEDGSYKAVYKSDCHALHKRMEREAGKVAGSTKSTEKLINCKFDSKYGTPIEYKQVTQEFCDDAIVSFNSDSSYKPLSDTYNPPDLEETVACELSYGTYQLSKSYCEARKLEDQEQDAINAYNKEVDRICSQAVQAWNVEKQRFWAGEGQEYSSSAEAALVLAGYMRELQNSLNSSGCDIRLSL